MPYWNEIPGGGGGRPLTDKEARFFMPLFKSLLFIGLAFTTAATVLFMGVFLWPAFVLIAFVLIRDRIKERSLKKKALGNAPRAEPLTQPEFPLTGEQVDSQRRRILGK